MSNQDFAQLSSSELPVGGPSQRPPKRKRRFSWGRLFLVIMLVGLVAAAFAGGHYLGEQHGIDRQRALAQQQLRQQLDDQTREIERLKRELAAKPKPKAPASTPTTEIGDLTFYDDLVNDKVDPASAETPQQADRAIEQNVADIIAQSQHNGTEKLPLFVQVGSFRKRSVADGVKQRVITLGMICSIQPVTLSGNRQRFRVRVGPYPDMKQALAAKDKLKKELHLNGLITRTAP